MGTVNHFLDPITRPMNNIVGAIGHIRNDINDAKAQIPTFTSLGTNTSGSGVKEKAKSGLKRVAKGLLMVGLPAAAVAAAVGVYNHQRPLTYQPMGDDNWLQGDPEYQKQQLAITYPERQRPVPKPRPPIPKPRPVPKPRPRVRKAEPQLAITGPEEDRLPQVHLNIKMPPLKSSLPTPNLQFPLRIQTAATEAKPLLAITGPETALPVDADVGIDTPQVLQAREEEAVLDQYGTDDIGAVKRARHLRKPTHPFGKVKRIKNAKPMPDIVPPLSQPTPLPEPGPPPELDLQHPLHRLTPEQMQQLEAAEKEISKRQEQMMEQDRLQQRALEAQQRAERDLESQLKQHNVQLRNRKSRPFFGNPGSNGLGLRSRRDFTVPQAGGSFFSSFSHKPYSTDSSAASHPAADLLGSAFKMYGTYKACL